MSLWGNVEKHATVRKAKDENIIRRMRFACWITKAKGTHSEYVILIAFPRQQWLRERDPILCLYVFFCLVCHLFEIFPWNWMVKLSPGSFKSGSVYLSPKSNVLERTHSSRYRSSTLIDKTYIIITIIIWKCYNTCSREQANVQNIHREHMCGSFCAELRYHISFVQ
jgi:hypothetical protein